MATSSVSLHFAQPQAYHDIYNNKNRWDKDEILYRSFDANHSSFGSITYAESKERKDVMNRVFSTNAIEQTQGLIVEKINAVCAAFRRESDAKEPIDIFYGFRCLTVDIITYLCFGSSVDAIEEPHFNAPIVQAMSAVGTTQVRFKYSTLYRNMILKCPSYLSKKLSPETAGVVDMRQMLVEQINGLSADPEKLAKLPHQTTIYHLLMSKEAYRTDTVPTTGSLRDEAQTVLFAGADTVGNTLMLGSFHLMKQPKAYQALKEELVGVWPVMERAPDLRTLERLPYLTAVIKEALRLTSGVTTGLSRVVPPEGASICGTIVPGKTIVSCGNTFVHYNADTFNDPMAFSPERWLEDPELEKWLVPFSKGPRMCLGINLAWAELRLKFAHVFRNFDMELDSSSPQELLWHDKFLPTYYGGHVKAKMTAVSS
ncbi:hypothetical protein B0A49_03538 [Cryomyces minteri]|uniref:Uncharacterized protein n=1 Tax=Cryomyces minteri TaxID=331657 RepID=A0A4U0X893_9PEZI|nr:hypothetical protein B0A49_03538 [Cryomyces minteri]